ncbi:MAG: HlyC/CorC family transporter [Anaerolineae bacterium]|nr:HlyC/CorC family transporter [Anaerolineae bacterium]
MTTTTALLLLLGALALVAMNGFFVVAEFALVSVRRSRIDELVAQGNSLARVVRHAISDPDRFIAATQLGITLASLGLGWIGEPAFAWLLAPLLEAIPGPWDEALTHSIAAGVAFAIITFLHVVLGELAPKSVALQYPERASLFVARPIVLVENLFRPLIWLLNGAGNGLLKLFGLRAVQGRQQVHSVQELRILMRESQAGGAIEADQEDMLQKVFEFGERQAREVMIPRPGVVGVEGQATLRDLLAVFAETRHARFPVYDDSLDNIVGIVAVKDILLALAQDSMQLDSRIDSLVRPALFVPETADVAGLFAQMRASHNQMAVVFDEYGGTAGVVTLEELLEEIVGRVSDELIVGQEPVVRLDETTVEIDALLRVDEVNEQLHLGLPQGDEYETVAGLLLYRLQHIPTVGEALQCRGLEIKVSEMKGPKIEKVQIRRTA